MAGLSVGIMTVPQSLSYARIAGLPSEYGLYGAFAPVFAYALFGSSRQLVRIVSVATLGHCRRQGAQLSRSSSWRDGSAGCLQRVGTSERYAPLIAPVSCGRCGPGSDHSLLLSNSLGGGTFPESTLQSCDSICHDLAPGGGPGGGFLAADERLGRPYPGIT